MKFIKLLLELGKVKITFAVTISTVTGYVLAIGALDWGVVLPSLGIFLLACGSSALNHYQEKDMDALMDRTSQRPIPSGKISPTGAILVALGFSVSGSVLLYLSAGFLALQLGLLALIWYNAIYTPLKRKTAFAVVPGSVIGAIPPLVGWIAAGGNLFDPMALILAFFYFIWQVPHFWLIVIKYADEYERAGYPTLSQRMDQVQIKRITFVWVVATIVTSLLLPLYGVITHNLTLVLLVLISIAIFISFTDLVRKSSAAIKTRAAFMKINLYFLLVMVLIWVDSLAL